MEWEAMETFTDRRFNIHVMDYFIKFMRPWHFIHNKITKLTHSRAKNIPLTIWFMSFGCWFPLLHQSFKVCSPTEHLKCFELSVDSNRKLKSNLHSAITVHCTNYMNDIFDRNGMSQMYSTTTSLNEQNCIEFSKFAKMFGSDVNSCI